MAGGLDKTETAAKPERSYRTDIDGIRSLAILSVVLFHAGVPHLLGGFTGVDVFFVLSGYLIGGHIFGELQTGRFSYARFYQRRVKRILPAFYVVLLFILGAGMVLLTPLNGYLAFRSAFAATLSASNFEFWRSTSYFAPGSEFNPLLMTWSLAVEEQFYVVIPLLMVLLARVRRNWVLPSIVLVCVASFAFAVLMLPTAPSMVFYLLPSRAWELGVGVALAVMELSWGRYRKAGPVAEVMSVMGLAGVVLPFVLLSKTTPFPGAAALPSVLGAALLLAVPQSSLNRRLLSLPPLVYIGRVSYSWYLWHWPVLAFLRATYGRTDLPLVLGLAAITASFGLAMLSYYGVEQPFRNSKRAAGPLLVRYAAVTACLLVVCAGLTKSHGFPGRYPTLSAMEKVTEERGSDPCLVGDGVSAPNLAPACYPPQGAGPERPLIALWGDSHSGAMAPGMRTAAEQAGYGFVQVGKLSCMPLIGALRFTPGLPEETPECERFDAKTLELLRGDRRIKIVVLSGFWAGLFRLRVESGEGTWLVPDMAHAREIPTREATGRLLTTSLTGTVRLLQAAGKQVMVLGDTPSFPFDPIWKVSTAVLPAQRALTRWLRVPDAGDPGVAEPGYVQVDGESDTTLRAALASIGDVPLIEIRAALCARPESCVYRDGDRLLYADGHHVTADGAHYALRGFHFPPAP